MLYHDIYVTISSDAYVWRDLDSITTHPTGSRLQRVDINFNYLSSYDNDLDEPDIDEVEKALLDCLPSLRTKGILFVNRGLSPW